MSRLVIALVMLLGFIAQATAEDVELQKIVVTPYRTAVISEPSDSSVEQINVSEADEKGVVFLKDILGSSSSITHVSSGSLGGETSVFLRGHN